MVAWLEGHPDSVDVDVWEVQKASYTFSHLSAWLDNGGAWESDNEDEHTVKERDLGKEKGKRTWKVVRNTKRRRGQSK